MRNLDDRELFIVTALAGVLAVAWLLGLALVRLVTGPIRWARHG